MQQYLKTLHDECVDLADHLRFEGDLHKDGYLVCLYGRVIELAGAIIHIIDSPHAHVAGILFRSTLETYVDFLNLLANRSYFQRIVATDHNKWIGVIANSQHANPYLARIAGAEHLDKHLKEHVTALAKLKEDNHLPLKPRDKFLLADLEDEYRPIYKFGSGEAHGDFGAVQDRHLVIEDGRLKIEFYKDAQNGEYLSIQIHLSDILLDCTTKLHRGLDGADESELQRLELAHDTKKAEFADV